MTTIGKRPDRPFPHTTRYEDHDLVCCTPYGRPWYPGSVTAHFRKLVQDLGTTKLGLHGTRSTYASVALQSGESLAAVSEVLGHADRTTTLRAYQDVHPVQHCAVASAVNEALMSQLEKNVTSNVTSGARDAKSGVDIDAASLVHLARRAGLEPATFRSGITRKGCRGGHTQAGA